jgi:hypothetical protein
MHSALSAAMHRLYLGPADIAQDLGQPSLGAIANHCVEFTGAPGHT